MLADSNSDTRPEGFEPPTFRVITNMGVAHYQPYVWVRVRVSGSVQVKISKDSCCDISDKSPFVILSEPSVPDLMAQVGLGSIHEEFSIM